MESKRPHPIGWVWIWCRRTSRPSERRLVARRGSWTTWEARDGTITKTQVRHAWSYTEAGCAVRRAVRLADILVDGDRVTEKCALSTIARLQEAIEQALEATVTSDGAIHGERVKEAPNE